MSNRRWLLQVPIIRCWTRRQRALSNNTNTPTSSWPAWLSRHERTFPQPLHLFAACLPGLENILHSEIRALGRGWVPFHLPDTHRNEQPGGVLFRVSSLSQIFTCHLYLGSASHIFIRCGGDFVAKDTHTLMHQVSRIHFWKHYFPSDQPLNLDIRVVTRQSRLIHTKVIAHCVERGIHKALGLEDVPTQNKSPAYRTDTSAQSSSTRPSVPILVRIYKDKCHISIDSSDTPLHRRGYRLETGKAPLREDIAFALLYNNMVKLKHQNAQSNIQILDPFCGSGTVVLEAAAIAMDLPPGRLRSSPLTASRLFSQQAWIDFVKISLSHSSVQYPHPTIVAMGSDRDRGVIDTAWNNAIRAGLQHCVTFHHCSISDNPWFQLSHKQLGISSTTCNDNNNPTSNNILVATNPPFGLRISTSHAVSTSNPRNKNIHPLLPLYQTLGKLISAMNYDACILAHDVILARRTGILNLKVAFTTKHGGLSVSALSTLSQSQ